MLRRGFYETGNRHASALHAAIRAFHLGRAWSKRIGARNSLVTVARKVAMVPHAMSRIQDGVPVEHKLRQNDQHSKRQIRR
jgi:hypothetical protein